MRSSFLNKAFPTNSDDLFIGVVILRKAQTSLMEFSRKEARLVSGKLRTLSARAIPLSK